MVGSMTNCAAGGKHSQFEFLAQMKMKASRLTGMMICNHSVNGTSVNKSLSDARMRVTYGVHACVKEGSERVS